MTGLLRPLIDQELAIVFYDLTTIRAEGSTQAAIPVSIVHTENEHEIRIISFRKATRRETQIYFDEIKN